MGKRARPTKWARIKAETHSRVRQDESRKSKQDTDDPNEQNGRSHYIFGCPCLQWPNNGLVSGNGGIVSYLYINHCILKSEDYFNILLCIIGNFLIIYKPTLDMTDVFVVCTFLLCQIVITVVKKEICSHSTTDLWPYLVHYIDSGNGVVCLL